MRTSASSLSPPSVIPCCIGHVEMAATARETVVYGSVSGPPPQELPQRTSWCDRDDEHLCFKQGSSAAAETNCESNSSDSNESGDSKEDVLNSTEAIEQRKALAERKDVRLVLRAWWAVADQSGDGGINKDEYLVLSCKITKVWPALSHASRVVGL